LPIIRILFVIFFILWIQQKGQVKALHEEVGKIQKEKDEAMKKQRKEVGAEIVHHFAPYFKEFNYDPSEARFIGDPIDFVIFPWTFKGRNRKGCLYRGKIWEKVLSQEGTKSYSRLNQSW
jgi:hypothetical protein